MESKKNIVVPDIGGATDVEVIDILVKVGDKIELETPLVTLESDKASMDIPSPQAGIVASLEVKVGDKLSEGDLILVLKTDAEDAATPKGDTHKKEEAISAKPAPQEEKTHSTAQKSEPRKEKIVVPDIGGATGVDVIELLVKPGDRVEMETPLVTLESDKASMEIPSPKAGVVDSLALKIGDKVSAGDLILILTADAGAETPSTVPEAQSAATEKEQPLKEERSQKFVMPSQEVHSDTKNVFAGPAVRRMARALGVNLSNVSGSGRKNRITQEDVEAYVKRQLTQGSAGTSIALPHKKPIDFSKFGATEIKPLSKIKRLTGINVHQAWVTIPQVTQFDQADITDLEAFRKEESVKAEAAGYKLTIVAFVCKIVSEALIQFPQFNSSLDESGEQLIYKKYYHIGIAAETPNGLVVPVLKDVDKKSVADIALELGQLSSKAREKGLIPAEMSGGCFTISSLGGIGGTAFTPIVNAPEVAILGLSRASIQPVYQKGQFVPRLLLPLSLTYDHRVIDGAEAARFTRYLSERLSDIRRMLL